MGFLSNLVGFENLFSKNITKDVLHNPTRLLTGIDPASTKVWNTVLGRDDQPLVNVYGSPGQQYYDQAKAEGIDTGAAQQFHGVADKIASYYGMKGLSNIGGGAAGAGSQSAGGGMGIMDMFSSGSGWGSLLGGILGAVDSHNQPDSNTTTQQNKLDPRIDAMLFGSNGSGGLLSQYQSYLNQPQSQPLQQYGQAAGDYLNNYGSADLGAIRNTATGLMQGSSAPQASAPAWAVGNQVQAPNQNNIDLTGSYQNLLSGGNTAALDKSLQSAVGLTNQSFQKNQTDLTNNLMRNVLPSMRSNSVLAGQYGGSRQGIAEGNALSDFTRQLTDANTTLGMANSANTTAQQANAYQQGQDRALAATQGLGAQQYGVAQQNAATKNAAEFMNVGNVQQNNMANLQAQLATNAQNNGAALGGAGLLGGLGSSAYGAATNNQNYGINRATQVNGLLAPYLSANSSSTNTQPLYQSTAGNVLGGAMLGGQLGSMFGGGGTSSQFSGSSTGGLLDLFGKNSSFSSGFGS